MLFNTAFSITKILCIRHDHPLLNPVKSLRDIVEQEIPELITKLLTEGHSHAVFTTDILTRYDNSNVHATKTLPLPNIFWLILL